MKKIMILGAGVSQVPLIRKAKDMSLYVIVVSRAGSYPGLEIADRVYFVDTKDAEQVTLIASTEKVDGICTTGTDVAVRTLGYAVSTLGLTGVSREGAALCTDKLQMKKALKEHGIQSADYIVVRGKQEAYAAYGKLTGSVMFKAIDGGASKGIVRVDHEEQIDYAYNEVMKWTNQSEIIVEQFIEGEEFGAQAFVYEDHITFILPHGDMVFQGDAGVPIGHYVPYMLPNRIMEDINETILSCVKALQLNNCAINADFMLSDNKVYVLEIGARAGATCLPELVSTYYGIDYYEQMIRASLGQKLNFKPVQYQPCACELLISSTSGRITHIESRNQQHPDIIDISFDNREGDFISKFKVGTDRIGQMIVKGRTLEETMQRLEQVKRNIIVTTNNQKKG
jgi:biotin carboxylase